MHRTGIRMIASSARDRTLWDRTRLVYHRLYTNMMGRYVDARHNLGRNRSSAWRALPYPGLGGDSVIAWACRKGSSNTRLYVLYPGQKGSASRQLGFTLQAKEVKRKEISSVCRTSVLLFRRLGMDL